MAIRGIKLPSRAVAGRLEMLESDRYVEQLISVALGDGESSNPWLDQGLGEFMVFAINDEQVEGEIRQRVRSAFTLLEQDQIAKLVSGNRAITFSTDGAKKRMMVSYINLETGGRADIDVPLSQSGG